MVNEVRSFNLTEDGSTDSVLVLVALHFTVYVGGTFDGATVSMEVTPDDGASWFTAESFTEDGVKNVCFDSYAYRFTATSAGASTDVNCYVRMY